ncbi:MAG: FTR1 family protein [Zoogloeaceae bacterium]|jgi:FTR1 family protein|nr:FTR1 family protein [Zoogloeaceae bacterium]
MFVPFLIMLREGLEAALIVGVIASYLHRTGRARWLPTVWVGVLLAAAMSIFLGATVLMTGHEFPQKAQELFEAIVGLVAVGVLTYMAFWMRGAARSIKAQLLGSVDAAIGAENAGERKGATWALMGMAFFAVAREGLESVFFLLAIFQQSPGWAAPSSALGGIAAAVFLGLGIYWGGVRLNLTKFFQWTGLFILLVAAGLLSGVLRNLHEAGVWNLMQGVVYDLSGVLSNSSVTGTVLSGLLGYHESPAWGEALAWFLYLVLTLILFLRPRAETKPSEEDKTGTTAASAQFSPAASSPSTVPGSVPAPARFMYLALFGSMALVVLSLWLFVYATRTAQGPRRGDAHKVVITDQTCEPLDFVVPAGETTFEIHNDSRRSLEWEILDGVMVVAERENIAPGFHSLLNVKLKPGEFVITCGLLSNPRGTLKVTPTDASEAERLRPPVQAFIGPLSEMRVFLVLQSSALARETEALAEAIKAGDLESARQSWLDAREPYKRMEAIVGRMSDVQSRLNPQAAYLADGEKDAAFIGFPRLEKGLFQDKRLAGLEPVARQLAEDAQALKERLRNGLQQRPEDLTESALWQARRLADGVIPQGENPHAQSDLADLQANLEGMEKSVLLLDALLFDANAPLAEEQRLRLQALREALDALRVQDAFPPYARVNEAQRADLAQKMGALADTLEKINPALGLQ